MVVIQAGHLNIGENCSWALREDLGHDGEVAAVVAVCQRAAALLTGRHVPVMLTDANFNCLDAARRDYQAVVSVHAGVPPAVGVGHPEADGAAPQSEQLAAAISKRYTERTGTAPLGNAQGAIDHYLFQVLSSSTPWALVELGELEFVTEHVNQVVEGLAVGLLDFLGVAEVEPVPQWKANLQPHAATIVLNRPARNIDLSSGIAAAPTPGPLAVAFLTQVGEYQYYVPAETAQGADPPIGWLRSEVDAAATVSVPTPAAPVTAAPAPAPTVAAAAASEPAPAPPKPPADSETTSPPPAAAARLVELLRELHQVIPDLLQHLDRP